MPRLSKFATPPFVSQCLMLTDRIVRMQLQRQNQRTWPGLPGPPPPPPPRGTEVSTGWNWKWDKMRLHQFGTADAAQQGRLVISGDRSSSCWAWMSCCVLRGSVLGGLWRSRNWFRLEVLRGSSCVVLVICWDFQSRTWRKWGDSEEMGFRWYVTGDAPWAYFTRWNTPPYGQVSIAQEARPLDWWCG